MAQPPNAPISDRAPDAQTATAYDLDHIKLYVRLLDAERAGAACEEVSELLLGIDAALEPERAQQVHASHLRRAHWMTEHGYRDLLKSGQ
jgi:hypothetical protein